MKNILFALALVAMPTTFVFAVDREAQTVSPELDTALLAEFPGVARLRDPQTDRINILIIGQDNRGPRAVAAKKTEDGRKALASRSDTIMVLSVKKSTHEITIFSYYRGFIPSPSCAARFGQSGGDEDLLNAAYFYMGRKVFIPCIEQLTVELLQASPDVGADYLDENGEFLIHGFLEGTKTETVKPMAEGVLDTVKNNSFMFLAIYNTSIFGVLGTFFGQDAIKEALANNSFEGLDDSQINERYLSVELAERNAYSASGYQRAFNFATVVQNILGWAAYGIQSQKDSNFQFANQYFGQVIDANLSHSASFADLEQSMVVDGDNILRYGCYNNDKSPTTIIQWGEAPGIYAKLKDGELSFSRRKGNYLGNLKLVPILPNPPSCGQL